MAHLSLGAITQKKKNAYVVGSLMSYCHIIITLKQSQLLFSRFKSRNLEKVRCSLRICTLLMFWRCQSEVSNKLWSYSITGSDEFPPVCLTKRYICCAGTSLSNLYFTGVARDLNCETYCSEVMLENQNGKLLKVRARKNHMSLLEAEFPKGLE